MADDIKVDADKFDALLKRMVNMKSAANTSQLTSLQIENRVIGDFMVEVSHNTVFRERGFRISR